MKIRFLAVILLLLTSPLPAQTRDPSKYERVLLPILTPSTPGANGSLWATRLWLRNKSDAPLDFFPLNPGACCCSVGCFRLIRENPALPPHATAYSTAFQTAQLEPPTTHSRAPNGAFIYVEKGRTKDLEVTLHVADTSRRPVGMGTMLPAVPEDLFSSGTVELLGVPITSRARVTLRIWDRDSIDGSEVRLRIIAMTSRPPETPLGPSPPPELLVDEVIRLTYDAAADTCEWWGCPAVKYRPAYAQLNDLLAAWPILATAHQPHGLRIVLDPLTPGVAIWSMGSVTENDTNLITVYTPD